MQIDWNFMGKSMGYIRGMPIHSCNLPVVSRLRGNWTVEARIAQQLAEKSLASSWFLRLTSACPFLRLDGPKVSKPPAQKHCFWTGNQGQTAKYFLVSCSTAQGDTMDNSMSSPACTGNMTLSEQLQRAKLEETMMFGFRGIPCIVLLN